jgi:hypothetical protein
MGGGLFASGIGTLIMLLVLVALAPVYNVAIGLVLGSIDDPVAEILIQLLYPALILMILYRLIVSREESFDETTSKYFGE